ncbi:Arginyl-tRNA synthetase [Lactobacillus equicursoris DSM 19284 = JCM 14600 = CIP 110162]|uniref:Arginine--tRNA ligase n=1 Tax=Lactobacillus equicursoris DSM 19284 = JCM 14600 = CIP 110162 TaxID=1293597 RepID=K0NW23_9LACO|nr:arginine--tRNA ligase [Lactobacillus equicursoris]KRL03349.1 arginine--tRNA ligase [Lactobacillus equicursoris DSM 19284 = JCM 14600 = CIP 110162]CCK85583.1 Arginyl-tRNA synthetase [Lactobacillus equicursoris DSM 19284 = JCM 14600 = CIP 110162]
MNGKQIVAEALQPVLPDWEMSDIEVKIERPKDEKLGDYAFPTFTLAKTLRKAPNLIASEMAEKIDPSKFEKVQAVGPYVNFFLNKSQVGAEILKEILSDPENYGARNIGQGRNVSTEYSSPNIAKPMGMGHLRSTMIGESIARILAKEGFKPIRIDYLGDWGTQFGKMMAAYKMWGDDAEIEKDPINTLLSYYVRINKEAADHPEYDDAGREWFAKLERGDEEAKRLWTWFREVSLERFKRVYKMLDVDFDSYTGEAFSATMMDEPVRILREKNLLVKSQGAEIVDLEKYNLPPLMVIKSNGTSTYITRDLATAMYRKKTYDFYKSIYVVGQEQEVYFQQLRACLKEMGFDWADDIVHISFGLMSINGQKMSTRKGNVVDLEDVLNQSVDLARKQIAEKNAGLANADEVAKQVGIGAVVFHDLKNYRRNPIDFNLEEVVKFEGETGPYVQYARARGESLLRKSGIKGFDDVDLTKIGEAEWDLVSFMGRYADVLQKALETYDPSAVAKFALELAKRFNKYYAHTRILVDDVDEDVKKARLAVVKAVSEVIKSALNLLDVKAPDEM